jgi:hypothetical protein
MMILIAIPWRIAMAMLTADIAARTGRSPFWWGLFGALFGIFALGIALCLRPRQPRDLELEHQERREPRIWRRPEDDGRDL